MHQMIFFGMFFKKNGKNLAKWKSKYSQKTRKSPPLSSHEESLAEMVKKYPCLFDKSQKTHKEETFLINFLYPEPLLFFSRFDFFFFRSFKKQKQHYIKLFGVHLDFS